MKHIVKIILLVTNLLFCGLLLLGAYSGLTPSHTGVLFELFFPFSLLCTIAFIIVWAIYNLKYIAISIVSILLAWGGISRYFPINLSHPIDKSRPGFTLMSYNIYGFADFEQAETNRNRTLDFILSQDADIVCLQEYTPVKPNKHLKITQEQVDSLVARYPYRIEENTLALLSKYPAELLSKESFSSSSSIAIYQVVINGHTITLANQHLESIGLTSTDKELYHDLTQNPNADQLDDVKTHLLRKLLNSAKARNQQADQIAEEITDISGPLIVCGDFNDSPLSYSVRLFQRMGFHDVYKELGSGPGITYHANRFWFRIDHILYRGDIEAIGLERAKPKSSDHYPLVTQFNWAKEKK